MLLLLLVRRALSCHAEIRQEFQIIPLICKEEKNSKSEKILIIKVGMNFQPVFPIHLTI